MDFSCDRCGQDFNEVDRIPKVLSECGHTFCEACLKEIFMNEEDKICPDPECGLWIREKNEN